MCSSGDNKQTSKVSSLILEQNASSLTHYRRCNKSSKSILLQKFQSIESYVSAVERTRARRRVINQLLYDT